jgi:CDP-6-deoxy-D-xylo-4-hexulose-3-dehydrase
MEAIKTAIEAYCAEHHRDGFNRDEPIVRLHEPTFSAEEILAALEPLLERRVTMGPRVKAFERGFCELLGFVDGVSNNSGSSANLLAIAALANPATRDRLQPGDEVIVPALCWSTTVWPLVQHGLVPVLVDIDPRTFCIDPGEIERAIGPKTRAIMPVHVYGNPCDMDALEDISRRRGLQIMEDCCEALGAFYRGSPVGSFGRAGTFSFYFSHHITTLEGGIVVSEDFELLELMRSLRSHGWTRDLLQADAHHAAHPEIDPRFLFVNQGYNLRLTEVQAAIGSVQVGKLGAFVEARRRNANAWALSFGCWPDVFDLQHETAGGLSSWFGFPFLVKPGARFGVAELKRHLNAAGIETRPIICGNIAAQPAMRMYPHRVAGDLAHANRVMRDGLAIGNHQAIGAEAASYVVETVAEFLRQPVRAAA